MMKPNFFIAGAPKCGTTALSEYLRSHPNIFMSHPKEPWYFAEDFSNFRSRVKSLEEYMGLFKECKKEHLAVGEASVSYLYSSVAIKNIYQFNKNAKIIVILRNPVDLIYSLHSHLVYTHFEKEKDFETAWNLQPSRKKGTNIPKTCPVPALLQYSEVAKLGHQVERLLSFFPLKQVKIILFNDLKTSAKTVYEDVLAFLEVPDDGRSSFPHLNVNKVSKLEWFTYYIHSLGCFVYDFKKSLGIKKQTGILNAIQKLNITKTIRPPLSAEFRAELVSNFKEDIEKLSRIINIDLSYWLK